MTTRLWAPLEVRNLEHSAAFYRGLGLSVVDSFDDGLVFGVGPSGRIEIVQTPQPAYPPPIAIEVPTWDEVGDGVVFPRGHYGRFTEDPDGHRILLWSETRTKR